MCEAENFYLRTVFLIVLFDAVELVEFLYGSGCAPAAMPPVILSAGQVFAVIARNQPNDAYHDRTADDRRGDLLGNAPVGPRGLNFVLVPRFGLVGAERGCGLGLNPQ